MKRTITTFLASALALVMVLSLEGCGGNQGSTVAETTITEATVAKTTEGNGIVIPDIKGTDESTAKNLLSSNGLIPVIEYEYDDDTEEGNVVRTTPDIGSTVEKNSKVTIFVSKGASFVQSTSSNINITGWGDKLKVWEFNNPYIKDETLYIECTNVVFTVPITWMDRTGSGRMAVQASISDTYTKTVPATVPYEKQSWQANEKQTFTIEIPLNDLDTSRPTDMFLIFGTEEQGDIPVKFSMTWQGSN